MMIDAIAERGRRLVGNKLKAIRKQHALTQEQAAELVHVEYMTWSKYERGRAEASAAELELFCLKLGETYPGALC